MLVLLFLLISRERDVAENQRPLNIPFKNSFPRKSQMWWHGKGNSGGSWLPEEKKIICGTEGEIMVAHGRLPSPAPLKQKKLRPIPIILGS